MRQCEIDIDNALCAVELLPQRLHTASLLTENYLHREQLSWEADSWSATTNHPAFMEIQNSFWYIWYDIYDRHDMIYMIWYSMIWYDMIYMIWYYIHDMIWYMIRYDIWYDMIWYIIYDMIRYMIWYDIWYDMIWYDTIWYDMIYDMINLLTAIWWTSGGSSTVHIYTQTIHRMIQNK